MKGTCSIPEMVPKREELTTNMGLLDFCNNGSVAWKIRTYTCGIDVEMLHEVGSLHVGHLLESGKLEDPGVGDDRGAGAGEVLFHETLANAWGKDKWG